MDTYEQAVADREQLEKSNVMEFGEESDGMTETVPYEALAIHNIPVEDKLDELLSILRPLAPVLQALPELMEKVDPLLEGLRNSPVLKMMGVKF